MKYFFICIIGGAVAVLAVAGVIKIVQSMFKKD